MNLDPETLLMTIRLEREIQAKRLERYARLHRLLSADPVPHKGPAFLERIQRVWNQLWRSGPEVHTTCCVRCETAH